MNDLIWIEISKDRIQKNIRTLRKLVGKNVLLAPVIKSNAYGHGIEGVASLLKDNKDVDWLCVNSIREATILRRLGVKKPVLIIGYVLKSNLDLVLKYNCRIFLYNLETARELDKLAARKKKKAKVHIKIDTGMNRQGVLSKDFEDFFTEISKLKNLAIEGIATHFANSDEVSSPDFFKEQLKIFNLLIEKRFAVSHSANSAAVLLYPESHFDLVRPGKAVYGYYPSAEVKNKAEKMGIRLMPSLTFKTRIAQIKDIPARSLVGYGCTFRTTRKTKIAVLPVGYYDGIDRKLSNRGCVLIRGERAKILGRISMNITVVDVSRIKNVKIEDEVVVIGEQGSEKITVEEIAKKVGTINYEITTRLRGSIHRYYV